MTPLVNWQNAYNVAREGGLTNMDIATIIGVSRGTIVRVSTGSYNHPHEPGYSGGARLIKEIKRMYEAGTITAEQLHSIRHIPTH